MVIGNACIRPKNLFFSYSEDENTGLQPLNRLDT